jgi:hypothetical protein
MAFALELYDSVRSPHYQGLVSSSSSHDLSCANFEQYAVLDGGAAIASEIRAIQPPLPADQIVKKTIEANFGQRNTGWIYKTNVS